METVWAAALRSTATGWCSALPATLAISVPRRLGRSICLPSATMCTTTLSRPAPWAQATPWGGPLRSPRRASDPRSGSARQSRSTGCGWRSARPMIMEPPASSHSRARSICSASPIWRSVRLCSKRSSAAAMAAARTSLSQALTPATFSAARYRCGARSWPWAQAVTMALPTVQPMPAQCICSRLPTSPLAVPSNAPSWVRVMPAAAIWAWQDLRRVTPLVHRCRSTSSSDVSGLPSGHRTMTAKSMIVQISARSMCSVSSMICSTRPPLRCGSAGTALAWMSISRVATRG